MRIVKEYENLILAYDRGKYDEWCVYEITNTTKIARLDAYCFEKLRKLATTYGTHKVYQDYVKIYEKTGKQIQQEVCKEIDKIATTYSQGDQFLVNVLFTEIYMMMVSEENRKYTLLGKRIKRLGVHMLLIENETIERSTRYSDRKKFPELNKACQERGF